MIFSPEAIRAVRPIAENVNDSKRLIPYIDECEKFFLMKAIGPAQYKLLDSDPKPENFETIMGGGFYDNNTKHFAGLRQAMGYLVYSRFVRNQNVNATAFGLVAKQGQFSDPVDDRSIVRIANDAEKIGLEYLRQCVDYLNFGKSGCTTKNLRVKSKFKAIGG